jgi:hypothetical protein
MACAVYRRHDLAMKMKGEMVTSNLKEREKILTIPQNDRRSASEADIDQHWR